MIKATSLKRYKNINHGFFTREGGKSSGKFASLNCGYGSGDRSNKVRANRAIAMDKLNLKYDDLNTAYQIHSNLAVVANERWSVNKRPKADAIVTNKVGLAIGVLTADCAPVLFADSVSGVIGVSHAGWRGALYGVLESCIDAMDSIGANRLNIEAVVGPCIQQKSYEVSNEFRQKFLQENSKNSRFFLRSSNRHSFYFNLSSYISNRLNKTNIKGVSMLPNDTYEEETKFYSYRRTTHKQEVEYGRSLSAIVLQAQ